MDTSDTTKIKIEDLASSVKKTEDSSTKFSFRLPIVIILTFLLAACVISVSVPLGYIAFDGTDKITGSLTGSLIRLTELNCKSPVFQDYLNQNWYDLMNVPSVAATLTLFNAMKMNPQINGTALFLDLKVEMSALNNDSLTMIAFAIFTFPNSTGLVPADGYRYNVTTIGVISQPCRVFRIQNNETCFIRGVFDYKNQLNLMSRILNPQTGLDLNNVTFVAQTGLAPFMISYFETWLTTGMFPSTMVSAFAAGTFNVWTLRFLTAYQPAGDTQRSGRVCQVIFESEVSLFNLFNRLKPTEASVMFMYDDQGFMAGSSVNNTIGVNETTRYTPTNNRDLTIQSVSKGLFNLYGGSSSFASNNTMDTLNVDGTAWVVATQTILTPYSNQSYRLVLMVPRVDFYGQSEAVRTKSLAVALGVAAAGFVIIGILGFVSSIPLRRLSASIQQLTKFDFSALENGKLERTSFVSEINDIEISFLTMVRAFAGAIKKNREIISRSAGGKGSSNAEASSNNHHKS
ncbi:hypothetical protein HDV05_002720 [Chytridiales sp. JEL 0842]|nr:hypothetical protein HDV05_002720 [Chytridiales sp. JEL 0842]